MEEWGREEVTMARERGKGRVMGLPRMRDKKSDIGAWDGRYRARERFGEA